MARVAVVGVGAIGSVIAALLQQAGRHEVVLCARRPLVGLTVETPDGPVAIEAAVLTDPAEATAVDWVLVATKAYDVAGAAQWLKGLCAAGAPVAVLQNGVEHRDRFAPYVAMESILPVMVDCPVEREAAGRVWQRGVMHLKVPEGALGRSFVELFAGTPADTGEEPDFLSVAWQKLCVNAAGALSALVLKPAGVVRGEAMGAVALQIVEECVAVGRAEGAQFEDGDAEAVLHRLQTTAADGVNSMLADRQAGRPMEVDARNGVIVRLGKKHGIPTPCNGMVVAVLGAMAK